MNTPSSPTVNAMIDGHRADSARRRQRVLAALDHAAESGEELSVSGIARRALLTELRGVSPHVNGDVVVSGATVCARDRRQ